MRRRGTARTQKMRSPFRDWTDVLVPVIVCRKPVNDQVTRYPTRGMTGSLMVVLTLQATESKGDAPMPYSAEISRSNPTCFIFLLDQSYSMADGFGEGAIRKADFVADVVNRTLHDLVIRCTRMEEIRNYYHIS